MQSEGLTEIGPYFCKFCDSYEPVSVDHEISKVGCYLVLQVTPLVNHNEKHFHKKYILIAPVIYTGSLDKGQYTAQKCPFLHSNNSIMMQAF